MKKLFFGLLVACIFTGCGKETSLEAVINANNGKDGSSCSVSPELETEGLNVIGARISCTDGSYSVILNGEKGEQGIQGAQGIQGPVGQTGQAAQACQVYRVGLLGVTFIKCPNQFPVAI